MVGLVPRSFIEQVYIVHQKTFFFFSSRIRWVVYIKKKKKKKLVSDLQGNKTITFGDIFPLDKNL